MKFAALFDLINHHYLYKDYRDFFSGLQNYDYFNTKLQESIDAIQTVIDDRHMALSKKTVNQFKDNNISDCFIDSHKNLFEILYDTYGLTKSPEKMSFEGILEIKYNLEHLDFNKLFINLYIMDEIIDQNNNIETLVKISLRNKNFYKNNIEDELTIKLYNNIAIEYEFNDIIIKKENLNHFECVSSTIKKNDFIKDFNNTELLNVYLFGNLPKEYVEIQSLSNDISNLEHYTFKNNLNVFELIDNNRKKPKYAFTN